MTSIYITQENIFVINALHSEYMIYVLYRNLSNILFSLVLINFLLFILMSDYHKLYCSGVAFFIYCIYFSGGYSKQSRKAGEQAIRYINFIMSGSSISDAYFSNTLQKLTSHNLMVPLGVLRELYIFIMISANTAPLTIAKAKGELTRYEKLVIWLAGGLPMENTGIKLKISLNSINYDLLVNFNQSTNNDRK